MTEHDELVEKVARALARKAKASEMGDAGFIAEHVDDYVTICWRDHIDRAEAAIAAISDGWQDIDSAPKIGPRPRVLVCKGCPAFETEAWSEVVEDERDTGQYAWCNAAGRRSMGAYHYDHSSTPKWCPALLPPPHPEQSHDVAAISCRRRSHPRDNHDDRRRSIHIRRSAPAGYARNAPH